MKTFVVAVVLAVLSGCNSLLPSKEACEGVTVTYDRQGMFADVLAHFKKCNIMSNPVGLPIPGVR
jgi:uncharacterized protein YceK